MDIIVETPKGSPLKYKYEPEQNAYRILKSLSPGLVFPFDFGFIPGTNGEDGDPLDVIVISEFQSAPGSIMEARIIGCMQASQTAENKTVRNDRFLAIPSFSRYYKDVDSVQQLPAEIIPALKLFFSTYLGAENKTVTWLGLIDKDEATQLLAQ